MRKRPSKRRVIARLRLGRDVPMDLLMLHDIDSQETISRFNLTMDWHRETVRRLTMANR